MYLGLKPWRDEYKTMGLAPYGNPRYCIAQMRRIIRSNPREPLEFENRISLFIQMKLRTMLSGQRFDNIAASVSSILRICSSFGSGQQLESWMCTKLRLGRIFLNVKANKRIIEMPEVEDAFFLSGCRS